MVVPGIIVIASPFVRDRAGGRSAHEQCMGGIGKSVMEGLKSRMLNLERGLSLHQISLRLSARIRSAAARFSRRGS